MSAIRESVHQLIASQIEALGLSSAYRIEARAIYGHNGTEFTFAGLADQTAESIKSYEAYDVAWIEEARVLSQRSLNILLPTIRKSRSQVIFTYNPELDTDPVHEFAASLQPGEGCVCDMHYQDTTAMLRHFTGIRRCSWPRSRAART
jgi:phage terminase large subunit